jgi:hypothetical protein
MPRGLTDAEIENKSLQLCTLSALKQADLSDVDGLMDETLPS